MRKAFFWISMVVVLTTLFSLLTPRQDFGYVFITYYNKQLAETLSQTIAPLANFDGVHYLQIAGDGYSDQARFLPLYPIIISLVTGSVATFSSGQLLIAWVSGLAIFFCMIGVWHKLSQEYSYQFESWPLLLWLTFPTSFFLIALYSESLFLLLAGLTLLLAKRKLWWWALIPAALLSITRLTGFVIIPTLIVLAWQERKSIKYYQTYLLATTLTILPLLGYAYFNFQRWGDWFYFVHAHGALGNSRETASVVFPLVTVYRYGKILLSLSPELHEFKIAVVELLGFFGMTSLWLWAWWKKLPKELLLFSGLAMAIPVLSGTLSGFPRYALAGLPLLLSLSTLPKQWKISLACTFFIIQILLLAWFSTGYFVA